MRKLLRSIYCQVPASRPLFRALSRNLPWFVRDRAFLESQVFAYLNRTPDLREILFAGVEIYTLHYDECLPGKSLRTIDIDPANACYGLAHRHTVGSVTALSHHYRPEQFDCVILNGLIGYGLDAPEDADRALDESFAVLRPGGLLIVGWNDTPKHPSFRIENLPAWRRFEPFIPRTGSLTTSRIEANPANGHTFDFLRKPGAPAPRPKMQ